MAHLLVIKGPLLGAAYPIGTGTLVIGRGSGVRIQLRGELSSREHARVRYDEQRRAFLVEDINSTHGTYVNGVPLTPGMAVALADGDLIIIGECVLEFRLSDPPESGDRPAWRVPRDAIRATRIT